MFSALVSASSPCVSPSPRQGCQECSFFATVTLQAARSQPVLMLAPARASSNNTCSRPIHVILLCFIPALRDVPRATLLLSSAAKGQAPALESCSRGRTARGICSRLLFQSALTFLTEGLSDFEKRNMKKQIPRTLSCSVAT